MARMGQENVETSTRVTVPACNRAPGNQRIAKTWSARARAPSEVPSPTGMARRPNTSWLPRAVTTTDGDRCRDAGKHIPEVRETDSWHRHEIGQNCVDMPMRTRCKKNRAQKSHSRTFCVSLFMALSACNGHCDGTKHTTIEENCEEFVLRSETSQNSTTSLEHRDWSNFAKVIPNFETSQHSHSWPRTPRWMNNSQNS